VVGRAILLSWLTIVYNLVEGAVSVYFGVADGSMALAGFGADSFIEVFSAALVLWRFRAEEGAGTALPVERERRATLGIGVLFVLLAVGTAAGALAQLRAGGRPDTTLPGLVISAASLSFMFYLWRAKLAVARELDSCTVLKDADCSLACIKLSGVLLAGSAVFAAAPSLWWSDAAAALVLASFIASEGVRTIRAALKPGFAGGCGCA
jgi:divalent metal cation (Fe/Co/Zn/Cd) transporter